MTDHPPGHVKANRRTVLAGSLGVAAAAFPIGALAQTGTTPVSMSKAPQRPQGDRSMNADTVALPDGTRLFYKDWGSGRPIVFHHG